ncbi:unnamed protein product [Cuscuta epithymum]|uniref:Uncharacterized protein n=1 Tax=Cuscuta epithymum TaxID=186058 RepID=A0AAV0FUT9_9ASTE|nr:unnamed protein product [Cuscuta epithymum]CAH9139091.1 unnamed protein product [Cuscuta epithymum]
MSNTAEPQEILGFSVQTHGQGTKRGVKPDKAGLVCTYCKYTGHDVTSYFELKGYPDWWGDRPRADNKNTGRGKGSTIPSGKDRGRTKQGAKAHAAIADGSGRQEGAA